jgi:aspartyl-tRNA(Asn)/glutamyl-tRNA(Gln) amidotransferase subunit A
LCTAGVVTTGGSRILENYVPPYTATAVARIEAAGGVVIGKTNMDEFGMGSSTENSAYGVTRNPWDERRVPGGSSGGSAAAVAAGVCDFALGSDTGGSIRQPASFCGVTGLKPSYGRVSRHGLLAYASSLDTVGPITRTVEDAARVLQVIAGHDPMDATTITAPVEDYVGLLSGMGGVQDRPLAGLTVGVVTETMSGDGVDADVVDAVRAAVEELRALGAAVRDVSLPRLLAATAAYYVLAPSEASANLARYDGVRYGVRDDTALNAKDLYTQSRGAGFGAEVKRRICVGTYALSTGYYDAYYLRAQRVRALVRNDYRAAFDAGVDVLVSPVAPTTAFLLGEKTKDPTTMYYGDVMTIPASLAGLPALSVPCGFCRNGMPVGLQIAGPYLDEATVLRVGHAFQKATNFHTKLSPVAQEFASSRAPAVV